MIRNLIKLAFCLALLASMGVESFSQVNSNGLQPSDQKAGSVLIFPFYGSGVGGNDTRITITNVGPQGIVVPGNGRNGSIPNILNNLAVHLFFIDSSCNQADMFVCFTKYQSYTFRASEWDPVTPRGWVLAVSVDGLGNPIAYNGLVGNAFVNTTVNGSRWLGNYGAESFTGIGVDGLNGYYYTDLNSLAQGLNTADLWFDDSPSFFSWGYDAAGSSLAVEFQSPLDATGQAIVTVPLNGVLGVDIAGNEADGVGAVYRDDEKVFSFAPPQGGCVAVTEISAAYPRIVGGITKSIAKGRAATMTWNVVNSTVGLFVTPANPGNAWPGIRGLHMTLRNASRLTIPIFTTPCGGPDIPPRAFDGEIG